MNHVLRWLTVAVGLLLSAAPAGAEDAGRRDQRTLPSEQLAFFEKKIRPVLVSQCYACHSADAKKVKGGLLLDTRETLRAGGE